jgi:hypothetical protein
VRPSHLEHDDGPPVDVIHLDEGQNGGLNAVAANLGQEDRCLGRIRNPHDAPVVSDAHEQAAPLGVGERYDLTGNALRVIDPLLELRVAVFAQPHAPTKLVLCHGARSGQV